MQLVDDIYSLLLNTFYKIVETGSNVVDFLGRSVVENLNEAIGKGSPEWLERILDKVTERITAGLPVLNDVSTFAFMLGYGVIFWTSINIIRFCLDILRG